MEREGMHYHALAPQTALYASSGRRSLWQASRFAWGVFWRLPRYPLRQFDVIDLHAFPFLSVVPFWLVHGLFASQVPWLLT